MRSLLTMLAVLAVSQGPARVTPLTVTTSDGARQALMATPPGPVVPGRPLVLLFHGHTGNMRNTLGQGTGAGSPLSAWLAIAAREGLVVVALDGARGADGRQGWNDGRPGSPGNPTTDDVAFARAVIGRVEAEQHTDPARRYAMGMSNGGVFTFRLALEMDPPLAAIAAACSSMPGDRAPAPPHAMTSVLMIEGTEDPLMPYAGGQVHFFNRQRGAVIGADSSLAFWRSADALSGAARTEAVPHRDPRDPTHVVRMTWGEDSGPQVRLVQVVGGGHCEPTLTHRYPAIYTILCGRQNGDLETAEEAWSFFRDKRTLAPGTAAR